MNFSPELTTGQAVFMALLAAFMWGTWFISLKYLGDYPLEAYIMTLFITSIIFVWAAGLIMDGQALFTNIQSVYAVNPSRITVTLLCGILYATGMVLSMTVVRTIGLSLSQPLQSSINILVGTFLAGWVGGVPLNLSIGRVVLSVIFLMAAMIFSVIAGNLRSRAQTSGQAKNSLSFSKKDLSKSLVLIIISSILVQFYTLAISYGLHSTTQPEGLAVMPFMALLVTGAFIGGFLSNGITLTIRKQWHYVYRAPLSIWKFGVFSGLFHYGGNIIHTFATAFLSSVISWPLGITSGLWTQMWGLAYGEFKGFPKIVYVALFSGIAFYLLGAFILATG